MQPNGGGEQGRTTAYTAMGRVVSDSMSELLASLEAAASPQALVQADSLDNLLRDFLIRADTFAADCCSSLARVVRQHATLPETRGMPTSELAKEIRALAFESLDTLVIGYTTESGQLVGRMKGIIGELRDTNIVDAAISGAAVGRVAGGLGSSSKSLGILNAAIQAGAESEKRQTLQKQFREVLAEVQSIALPAVVEYVKRLRQLPEGLLDYSCARCFGGSVSFEQQQNAVTMAQSDVGPRIDEAIRLVVSLPETQRSARRHAAEVAVAAKKAERSAKWRAMVPKGSWALKLGIVVVALLAVASVFGIITRFPSTPSTVSPVPLPVPSNGKAVSLAPPKKVEAEGNPVQEPLLQKNILGRLSPARAKSVLIDNGFKELAARGVSGASGFAHAAA